MTNGDARQRMLDLIRSNIQRFGRHVYTISGGESPRFAYTIGLTEKVEAELVLAGCAPIPDADVGRLLNAVAEVLESGTPPQRVAYDFGDHGTFTLGPVHASWVGRMLLGALDYYGVEALKAFQVIPDQAHGTLDLPHMAKPYSPGTHPVWKWLDGGWPYAVPADALTITNLDALQGYAVSEVMRWEEGQWEMFSGAGPEVPENEIVKVPLATLIAFDATLEPVVNLKVGTGLYREYDDDGNEGPWCPWVPKGS